MIKYRIEKKGKGYVVVNQDGRIANDHTHKTRELAENHWKLLESLFADEPPPFRGLRPE